MLDADDLAVFPVADWIQSAVEWLSFNFRPFFTAVKWPVERVLLFNQDVMLSVPFPLVVVLAALVAYLLASRTTALFTAASLIAIAVLGVWQDAMTTLSLILTAIFLCTLIGIPVGIWSARSDRVWRVVRPVLDVMQTTPTFVYLVPVVMLFGVGTVPGEVAVIVSAVPPLIRFTNIGIRQVDTEIVEAGHAFGADARQMLWEIQLPLAIPTILGGLNQTVLTAMVMSVVVAMIGAEGLGLVVMQGLGRLDVGSAAVGGIAIVLLAMILDRITQEAATKRAGPGRSNAIGKAARRLLFPAKTQEVAGTS